VSVSVANTPPRVKCKYHTMVLVSTVGVTVVLVSRAGVTEVLSVNCRCHAVLVSTVGVTVVLVSRAGVTEVLKCQL